MAVDVVGSGQGGIAGWGARVSAQLQALPASYRSVMAELRRVTWPSRQQIKEMSIGVIALSLGIGAVIAVMDFILQEVLVRWIPQIFAGR
jgi:preprotein translocase subunit SecE